MTTNMLWMCAVLDGVERALLEVIEGSQDTHQQTTWPWKVADATQSSLLAVQAPVITNK